MKKLRLLFVGLILTSTAYALQPGTEDVFARVVDTGPALCCVVRIPGGHYFIYDAGHYLNQAQTFRKVTEIIPPRSAVDLLVLSHSDADHLGLVDEICNTYAVKRVIWSGWERDTATWRTASQAIRNEAATGACAVLDLCAAVLPRGQVYTLGAARVQMISGFCHPPSQWPLITDAERYNAGSIVCRLTYQGHAILFPGDEVGRHNGQAADTAIATEAYMIAGAGQIPLVSDVLIAPHHGADNASSTPFIRAVSPRFVIFSAGHEYRHPRATTARRYLNAGVALRNMYRTDFGDDEGPDEWSFGRVPGPADPVGDDDVDIALRQSGEVGVEYRDPANQHRHESLAAGH